MNTVYLFSIFKVLKKSNSHKSIVARKMLVIFYDFRQNLILNILDIFIKFSIKLLINNFTWRSEHTDKNRCAGAAVVIHTLYIVGRIDCIFLFFLYTHGTLIVIY